MRRPTSASIDRGQPEIVTATVVLESTLTCPHCGHEKAETMPTNACQWFYECQACRNLLRPRKGDCCVFCSYGSVPCPPIQDNVRSCCAERLANGRTLD